MLNFSFSDFRTFCETIKESSRSKAAHLTGVEAKPRNWFYYP
jgi:hypothetical protein